MKGRSLVRLVLCVAVLIWATSVAALAQQSRMAFTVSMPDPASHLYHVALHCDNLPGDSVEFRMPVWTPGYYGLFDFAGNVRGFTATDGDGRTLPAEKISASGWTVRTGGSPAVTVSYQVLASSPFVANAYLDETRGYITPGALFVYVPGRLRDQVTVTIEPHPTWSMVATGLDPVSPDRPRTFVAPDFDVLYDSPILIGNLESLPQFEIRGVPHRFVGYGLGEFDRSQFIADLKAVIEAGIEVIGEIPYTHYTFLAIGPGQGGIEHLNSAAVSFSGRPNKDRAARNRELAFLAHEYFHHYNVKRIRPIALGPFDYDKPNPTNMLWVSEGFTVYYEYLMLARSGRMTQEELLDALGRTIAATENNTGRLFQSATESSRDTWSQGPFGRRGNGLRRTVSYYDKGAVLAMLLDLRIRHETKNRRSLDTVMRALYRKYYRELGRGWTDEEFRQVCEATAGVWLDEIFDYASTTREIDYAKHLSYAGLEMEPAKELPDGWLGALVEDKDGRLTIAAVESRSPAGAAGLRANDVVKSVERAGVDAKGLEAAIATRKPGTRMTLTVTREGRDRQVKVVLGHKLSRSFRIGPAAKPSAQQAAILKSLMESR